VLKIVLTVLTIVLLVTLGIQLASQPLAGLEFAQALGTGLLGILSAAMQAFGNIALVFAILERVLPASEFKFDEEQQAWDPGSLKKVEEREAVKPWEPTAAIVLTAAAMIIFNGYADRIGIYFLKAGTWTMVPVLTEAFFRWLPTLNILWALQIALNVVVLRQGRWQPATKLTDLALDAAGIVIGYLLVSGPSIVSVSSNALLATGAFDAATATVLSTMLEQAVRWVIIIVMLVQGAEIVQGLIQLILRRR
jgi:hypothetical protein